MGDIKRIIYQM